MTGNRKYSLTKLGSWQLTVLVAGMIVVHALVETVDMTAMIMTGLISLAAVFGVSATALTAEHFTKKE